MGWKKLVSFIFIISSISSCCVPLLQKKYYTTEYGSNRPKKSKFKLLKTRDKLDEKFFDENSVYIKIDSVYGKNPKTGVIELSVTKSYERYFKTGQYIQGTCKKDSNLSLNDYNNLKSGIVGYYKIENNKVLYEYFLVTPQNCGDYYKAESKIIGDSIAGYKKVKIEGLTGKPDW
jgi:hypothetical protein